MSRASKELILSCPARLIGMSICETVEIAVATNRAAKDLGTRVSVCYRLNESDRARIAYNFSCISCSRSHGSADCILSTVRSAVQRIEN